MLKIPQLQVRQKCSRKFLSSIWRADITQTKSITDTLTKGLSKKLSTDVAKTSESTTETLQKTS